MKKLTQNNKNLDCPVCEGTGKTKVIKNIAQIGKYHLGKEDTEECKFCTKKFLNDHHEQDGTTLQ